MDVAVIVAATHLETTEMSAASGHDAFVRRHVRLVYHVARRLQRSLKVFVELDELVSAGMLGLLAAAESYDPGRGVRFSSFAVPRIRGAILDELRRMDLLPRQLRTRLGACQRVRNRLAMTLQREPVESEVADSLGIGVSRLREWENAAVARDTLSLDQIQARGHAVAPEVEFASEIDERLERAHLVAKVRAAMAQLSHQERTVLALCYFEDLKLREIGQLLGISESRVSQIRSRALARLRDLVSHAEHGEL